MPPGSAHTTSHHQPVSDDTARMDQAPYVEEKSHNGLAYINSLSAVLNQRYETTGEVRDREKAIFASRLALFSQIGVGSIDIDSGIDPLCGLLEERFLETHVLADIDEAITWRRMAVGLDPTAKSEFWHADANNLSRALLDRYRSSKLPRDLEAAIGWALKAMESISADHENYGTISYQLAVTHQAKWERYENPKDLDEEIRWYRESVALEPTIPYLRHRENLLGVALCIRAEVSRSTRDMEESLRYLAATRDKTVPGSEEYIRSLNNIANAYETAADIDGISTGEAIKHALEAANLAVDMAQQQGYRNLDICFYNLANTRELEYRKIGSTEALHKAIDAARSCVEKTPPDNPRRQKNTAALGILLCRLYEQIGEPGDFHEAVGLLEEALGLIPTWSKSLTLPRTMHQLGLGYAKGYELEGNPGYLSSAIDYLTQAANHLSDDNPMTAGVLMHLFDLLVKRSAEPNLKAGDADDTKQAIQAARRALGVITTAPSIRIRAAYGAGRLMCAANSTPQSRAEATELLAQAVRLLPFLAPVHVATPEQQRRLETVDASRMTSDAVALALETGDSAMGLNLLETGRGVILGNLLQYRLDFSKLRDAHPTLADDVERLRKVIDECQESIEMSLPGVENGLKHGEHYRLRMAQVVDELGNTYERIRREPGFEDFMRPLSFSHRHFIREEGQYVIAINLSARRCDAIIMSSEGLSVVDLPDLSLAELTIREQEFRSAILGRRKNPDSCRRVLVELLRWIWWVCGKPLMASLGLLDATKRSSKPRVWWVLGGLLGRLPVHACGHYTILRAERSARNTMYDCVVSSYAPTIRALEYALERAVELSSSDDTSHSTLIVAVPHSEGRASLLEAEGEALEIQGFVQAALLQINPTFSEVVDALQDCEAAHFACHGISNANDLTKSYLRLRDFRDSPLSVGALLRRNPSKMHNCKFAYLSACETAYSANEHLADESLHLVSGFLMAGCPRVIGTLWEIPDDEARELARMFYSLLPRQTDGGLDVRTSAETLDSVINSLREDPRFAEDPLMWAPFIHAGV
ncbi:CHAT domain-containing protein [Dactylonectria macrodidyma]|uniref:CHAT domain-containing protein n=1 Tax=Dactylonectria macrodidyma TaxID=307937 RepID=A0A9P9I7X8_9HYPO|nr:CHAT domain-containing protein [Dactylonectria macrodidyma]